MKEELLRFTTAGSVDDGKSTLIGRLLYDSKNIFADQLEALQKSSERKGLNHIDLSLLTDGLKDEREQGITLSSRCGNIFNALTRRAGSHQPWQAKALPQQEGLYFQQQHAVPCPSP